MTHRPSIKGKSSDGVLSKELDGFRSKWKYAVYAAFLSKKISVRFSSFGFLLEPFFLCVSSLAIALVWNKLFGRGGGEEFYDFFLYILLSFGIWGYLSDAVNLGANTFKKNSYKIINSPDPIVMYVFSDQTLALISFLLKLPIMLLISALVAGFSWQGPLYLTLGLLLVFLSGIGFGLFVGFLCLVFRDIRTIIDAIMRVAFLLTPIIWHVERLGEYKHYIYFNPFYNYLAVCRDGFTTGSVGSVELVLAASTTLSLLIIGFTILALNKKLIRQRVFEL